MMPDNPLETAPAPVRKVFIKTYGCQMNVYDSQRMADALAAEGYGQSDRLEDADLVLLNTCHIREKAEDKVFSALGKLKEMKAKRLDEGRPLLVGVAGCVAQAAGRELMARASGVDLVIGPQAYHRLGGAVVRALAGERVLETDFAVEDKFNQLPAPAANVTRTRGVSAFLTIQEGCDKFCTFCVVPYTRGSESSRPADRIIAEAERLAAAGVRELTLLGQNVNAWSGQAPGGGTWRLGRLLAQLAEIPGIARLRYTTSHPRDMDDELIAMHRDLPALMPYLHLPVQSGSDRILKAMNRRHKAVDYRRLVDRIRTARPDIALSGDFITGFPGETEADFRATLKLVEDIGYAAAYTFRYSPRPGTPAAAIEDLTPDAEQRDRLYRLQALIAAQQASFANSLVGSECDVLIEKPGLRPGQKVGRSPWLQPVILDESDKEIGDIVRVRITGTGTNSLYGEAV